MVFFTCSGCGESLKKNKVENHVYSCRGCEYLTCIDCGADFYGDGFKSHVQCMTENEKYSAKGTEFKPNKGDVKQQQWLGKIESITKSGLNLSQKAKNLISNLGSYDNIPRKRAKFLNFLKNSLRIYDAKLGEEVWEALSAVDKEPKSEEPCPKLVVEKNTETTTTCINGEGVTTKEKKAKKESGATIQNEESDGDKLTKKKECKSEDFKTVKKKNSDKNAINVESKKSKKKKKRKGGAISANNVESEDIAGVDSKNEINAPTEADMVIQEMKKPKKKKLRKKVEEISQNKEKEYENDKILVNANDITAVDGKIVKEKKGKPDENATADITIQDEKRKADKSAKKKKRKREENSRIPMADSDTAAVDGTNETKKLNKNKEGKKTGEAVSDETPQLTRKKKRKTTGNITDKTKSAQSSVTVISDTSVSKNSEKADEYSVEMTNVQTEVEKCSEPIRNGKKMKKKRKKVDETVASDGKVEKNASENGIKEKMKDCVSDSTPNKKKAKKRREASHMDDKNCSMIEHASSKATKKKKRKTSDVDVNNCSVITNGHENSITTDHSGTDNLEHASSKATKKKKRKASDVDVNNCSVITNGHENSIMTDHSGTDNFDCGSSKSTKKKKRKKNDQNHLATKKKQKSPTENGQSEMIVAN